MYRRTAAPAVVALVVPSVAVGLGARCQRYRLMARTETDSSGSCAAYVPPERRLNVTRWVTDVRRGNDSVSRPNGRDLRCGSG